MTDEQPSKRLRLIKGQFHTHFDPSERELKMELFTYHKGVKHYLQFRGRRGKSIILDQKHPSSHNHIFNVHESGRKLQCIF